MKGLKMLVYVGFVRRSFDEGGSCTRGVIMSERCVFMLFKKKSLTPTWTDNYSAFNWRVIKSVIAFGTDFPSNRIS